MQPEHTIVMMKVRGPSLRNFTYLVVDRASGRAAIVDPAWELDAIIAKVEELGVALTTVLLTHSHFDHVNCVTPLIERYPVEVYMSAREIDNYGFRCERLQAFEDGDVVRVGNTAVSCLLTPGHTAGGACYLLSDAMFSGDTVFTEGCGLCTAPGGSPEEMFESFAMIKQTVDHAVRVFPGHSFGMEPGQSLRVLMSENIYFQLDEKEKFVGWRMRESGSGSLVTR